MKLAIVRPFALSLFVLASSASAQATNASDVECQKLNQAYNSVLYLPNEPGYSSLRIKNWSGTANRTPACIFKPDNANDLAKVVQQLQQNNISFAIRSGGHLPSPNAANIDGGVLIDLGGFNKVTYDSKQGAATVGSGTRWAQLYGQLDQYNVTVVGGRVVEVGVGGLTLGSGLSYLTDLYGFACDNVLNYEVVLGDGTVVNANSTSNADLFWALKGGGNNFGIVTKFTMKTYPDPQVWGGVKAYTLQDLPALYSAMYEYQTVSNKDPKANLMLQGYVSNQTIGIVLNMVYMAPEPSPAAFAPFYHINTTADTTKITSLTDFLSGQGPVSFPPRVDWRTTTFTPDKGLYDKLNKLMTESAALEKIKGVQSGTVAFGMQPISESAVRAGIARGGNALGLQNTNQTWFVVDSGWAKASDDQTVHDATKEIVNSIQAAAQAAQKHVPYLFMNDASYDQDVLGGYGSENVAKMRAVSAKYDPHQVFQQLVPGGFKIPRFS